MVIALEVKPNKGEAAQSPTAQAGNVEEFGDARRTDAGIVLDLVEGFSGVAAMTMFSATIGLA